MDKREKEWEQAWYNIQQTLIQKEKTIEDLQEHKTKSVMFQDEIAKHEKALKSAKKEESQKVETLKK